jgi:hypothetical protein
MWGVTLLVGGLYWCWQIGLVTVDCVGDHVGDFWDFDCVGWESICWAVVYFSLARGARRLKLKLNSGKGGFDVTFSLCLAPPFFRTSFSWPPSSLNRRLFCYFSSSIVKCVSILHNLFCPFYLYTGPFAVRCCGL